MNAIPVATYTNVHIASAAVSCAAGHDLAAAERCLRGASSLQTSTNIGLCGTLPADMCSESHNGDITPLACGLAERCWQQMDDRTHLALTASKGATGNWLDHDRMLLTAAPEDWPGSISPRVARHLGIGWYRESAPVAACSTGLYALLAGADALATGLAGQSLCGAVDRSLQPWLLAGFHQLGVIAKGQPEAFTATANGFAPGEGGAMFRLGHQGTWRITAGVRLGDAGHETRCTDPAVLAACLRGLWQAGPPPEAIITHGTGTRAGDAYERTGLDAGPWRSAERIAWKPLIGHCLGASGAVELALALHGPWQRIWKLSNGFGGHMAAIALERD